MCIYINFNFCYIVNNNDEKKCEASMHFAL